MIALFIFCKTSVKSQIKLKSSQYSRQVLLKEWEKLEFFKKMAQKEVPNFGFYAALVWEGKVISAKKMGYANRETKLPLDENTIFMWGSVSKMFTAISIAQLIEKNTINLDDPVIKYVPELGDGVDSLGGLEAIKIYHFLNHNSGLNLRPCYDSLRKVYPRFKTSIPSTKEISPFLKLATQNFTPGKKFQYSNSGYSLLGVIIERITKMKFTKYVTKNIFEPLGMKTAHYGVTPKKLSKYFTRAYYRMKNGKVDTMNFDVSQGFQEGNGGVKATVKDMLKFMDFLKFRKRKNYLNRYEKVLPVKVLENNFLKVNFIQPDVKKFSSVYQSKEIAIYRPLGFTYEKSKVTNASITGHSGGIAYHTSYFFFSNEYPCGVILICNHQTLDRKHKDAKIRTKLIFAIRDFLLLFNFNKDLYTWP